MKCKLVRTLEQLLKFLQGKKGTIAGVLGLIITYMATEGVINQNTSLLFGGLNTMLFGGASWMTKKMIDENK